MSYKEFENAVGDKVFNAIGEWNTKHALLCKRCFKNKMNISDTVSHITLKPLTMKKEVKQKLGSEKYIKPLEMLKQFVAETPKEDIANLLDKYRSVPDENQSQNVEDYLSHLRGLPESEIYLHGVISGQKERIKILEDQLAQQLKNHIPQVDKLVDNKSASIESEIHDKAKGVWQEGYNTSPLADTGDYMSESFITNGEVQLFCYDEQFVEEDGMKDICLLINAQWQQSNSQQQGDSWISVETPPPTLSNNIWYQCAVNDDILLTACTYYKYGFTPYGSAQEDGRVTHYRPLGNGPLPNKPQ